MRTNCDITIYNRYVVSGAEKYQRVVVLGVAWENRKAANTLASGGKIAAYSARVFIPFARGVSYIEPKAWQALTSKTGKWTLQEDDVIVKGAVTDEIVAASTDPITHVVTPAFTITSLKAKYDDVLTVASVDTMDTGSFSMQHWNVGLK